LAASLLEDAPELELGCEALDPELESLLLGAALDPPEEPDFEVSELAELDELLAGSLEPEGAALEPPEAEPDFEVSELEPDEELGAVDDAPPEAEPDVEPGALDGDDGVVALLELDEPGAEDDLLALSRSHAARPKARATATARVESFMGPPWG
jgi:hypothetical protein